MSNKKKIDQIVHDVVEETLDEMGEQIADKLADRLISVPALVKAASKDDGSVNDQKSDSPPKRFNPEAGP